MAASSIKKIFFLGTFTLLLIFSRFKMTQSFPLPFPSFSQLVTKTGYGFQDAAFISLGFRSLAADLGWIQLLQNMGDYGHADENGKNYPFLKDDTLRVTRIDPFFRSAYLFGAATLAWLQSTNRPDEAMEVLEEGVKYNPGYWPLQTYAAGIGYKQANQRANMILMLEEALRDPDCPTVVKSILANTYKVEKRYVEALALWEDVLSSEKGRDYHARAQEEIPKLQKLLLEQPQN